MLDIAIALGWWAYLCDRVGEAIDLTEKAVEKAEGYGKCLGFMNLGLYYLGLASRDTAETDANVLKARKRYEMGKQVLSGLSKEEQVHAVNAVIDDLVQNKEKLHQAAEKYLEEFQALEKELLS